MLHPGQTPLQRGISSMVDVIQCRSGVAGGLWRGGSPGLRWIRAARHGTPRAGRHSAPVSHIVQARVPLGCDDSGLMLGGSNDEMAICKPGSNKYGSSNEGDASNR